ncbi:MAG: integrase [Methylotenera sp.]|nr:MAG: integrase [Methylotenera sp.]
MEIQLNKSLSIVIRYVYQRNNVYYYQRKIPLDLRERFNGQLNVKINLETSDLKEVARKVEALNKKHESSWQAMRENKDLTSASVTEEALRLLKSWGLSPYPIENDPSALALFRDHVIDPKREAYADGDEWTHKHADASEYLDKVELEAGKLLNEGIPFLISDAMEFFLQTYERGTDEKYNTYTRRAVKRLIEIVGDKPFIDVNRADANLFVAKLLESRVKTATVKRLISSVRVIYHFVIKEKEMSLIKENPFSSVSVSGFGKDAKRRTSFSKDQLNKLRAEYHSKDDSIRWLVALQTDLGCRLGEAAGLALDDLHLNAEIPYVSIRPHPWRSLKTEGSERDVPLVGDSLWAAKRIVETSAKDAKFAFPRYTTHGSCNANNASATINKWFQTVGLSKTTHELRHTMTDRLRNTNANAMVIDAVCGWGKKGALRDVYGFGFALQMLHEALLRTIEKDSG